MKENQTSNNGARTRDKILDAAEELFGLRGFAAVSLRDITNGADVTLALASYHFGTKENLFGAVVARRAQNLCDIRKERLEALKAPSVRALLNAFMHPLFEKATCGEEGWTNYLRLLTRIGTDNEWLHLFKEHFDETARLYIAALQKALPQADPDEVIVAFNMMLMQMVGTVSKHPRFDSLLDQTLQGEELESAYDVLLQFTTCGFEGLEHRRA